MTKDTRYPYTYAADYIRSLVGFDGDNVKLSRAEAASIKSGIAAALGMQDSEFAEKLADFYLKNEKQITEKTVSKWICRA